MISKAFSDMRLPTRGPRCWSDSTPARQSSRENRKSARGVPCWKVGDVVLGRVLGRGVGAVLGATDGGAAGSEE